MNTDEFVRQNVDVEFKKPGIRYLGWIYIEKSDAFPERFFTQHKDVDGRPVIRAHGTGAEGAAASVAHFEETLKFGPIKLDPTPIGLRVYQFVGTQAPDPSAEVSDPSAFTNFQIKLNKFTNAVSGLLDAWMELKGPDFDLPNEEYPFNAALEEVFHEVISWKAKVEEKLSAVQVERGMRGGADAKG